MTILDITRSELEQCDALSPKINTHIRHISEAISDPRIPMTMKSVISATQLIVFASQFRRNILLWDNTLVPVNTISFCIAGSGMGKDSAVHASRKCFKSGYDLVLETRKAAEIKRAIKIAIANDEDPEQAKIEEIYKKYLRPLPPIDVMPTTGPGLIQHINDTSDLELTSCFLYTG